MHYQIFDFNHIGHFSIASYLVIACVPIVVALYRDSDKITFTLVTIVGRVIIIDRSIREKKPHDSIYVMIKKEKKWRG